MHENLFKAVIAAALAALGAYLRFLMGPLVFLIVMMFCDYVSGVMAAWVTETMSSRVGIVGIVKKVGYLLIVMVGCAIDYLINLLGANFGMTAQNVHYVGLLVIVWLIINEGISILENVAEMKGPVPPFLGKLLSHLKRSAEDAGGKDDGDE